MNRFQFRAPPSGSTTINKPKPKPLQSEDLWGDFDDDLLVQASPQVPEKSLRNIEFFASFNVRKHKHKNPDWNYIKNKT